MSSRYMDHLSEIVHLVDQSEKAEIKEEWHLDMY